MLLRRNLFGVLLTLVTAWSQVSNVLVQLVTEGALFEWWLLPTWIGIAFLATINAYEFVSRTRFRAKA